MEFSNCCGFHAFSALRCSNFALPPIAAPKPAALCRRCLRSCVNSDGDNAIALQLIGAPARQSQGA